MHHPLDHVLAVVLTVIVPIRAALAFRRLKASPPEKLPALCRKTYVGAIAMEWTLTLVALALWVFQGRRWVELGLEPRWTLGLYGVLAGVLLITIVIFRQRLAAMRDDETLEELRRRMGHLEVMLPHSPAEFRRFVPLGVTAGVCEELLYRGYMIWYLAAWGMGMLPAAALSSVIFGLGHAYQGRKGILQTGALGAVLAGIYLVSGSIYSCMLIHVLMDLHSGHLMMKAYMRRAEQEREAAAESSWVDEGGPVGAEPGPAGGA